MRTNGFFCAKARKLVRIRYPSQALPYKVKKIRGDLLFQIALCERCNTEEKAYYISQWLNLDLATYHSFKVNSHENYNFHSCDQNWVLLVWQPFQCPHGNNGELENLKFVGNRYTCFFERLNFKKQFEFNEGCRTKE